MFDVPTRLGHKLPGSWGWGMHGPYPVGSNPYKLDSQQKLKFSSLTPTSYGNLKHDAGPFVSDFFNARSSSGGLVALVFAGGEGSHISRAQLYDGGTIGRKWHAPSEAAATRLFRDGHGVQNLDDLISFPPPMTEVMARLCFDLKTTKMMYFSDDLESRLLAQLRASDIKFFFACAF